MGSFRHMGTDFGTWLINTSLPMVLELFGRCFNYKSKPRIFSPAPASESVLVEVKPSSTPAA
jgi:hypothetical protein